MCRHAPPVLSLRCLSLSSLFVVAAPPPYGGGGAPLCKSKKGGRGCEVVVCLIIERGLCDANHHRKEERGEGVRVYRRRR
ncbi:hypothetical protein HanXRQr2_Chr17g0816561 [Helianthus annuus]|uniref:Secreted protein n=1 Tax=Helianthus annuus TaxID=4232 RepID=A0A9K3DJE1_HELAN|nr:hypothetical protein HanXRQr2_Chr17g0816561 [Helianthus annuus]KAJ0434822.1 hypothetical protein HanIR_Chr17g0886161 [Helianthus annuus]